jgi:hypothetical protein
MTMMRDDNVADRMVAVPATQPGQSHNDIVPPSVRTAWDVIEEACIARITGEMTLTTASPFKTRVYITNGLVYFAEHDADEPLAARLVVAGALEPEQLHRGSIRLNGSEHLGRLFERDTSIDRDAVELAVELITEQTLTDIAEQPVASYRTAIYRHHPSGIARWFSSHHAADDGVAGAGPGRADDDVAVKPALTLVPPAPETEEHIEDELVTEPEPEVEPEVEVEVEVEPIVADVEAFEPTVSWPIYAEPEVDDDASFFAVAADVEPLVAELAAWSTAVAARPLPAADHVVELPDAEFAADVEAAVTVEPEADAPTWDLVADVAAQLGYEPQHTAAAAPPASAWGAPAPASDSAAPAFAMPPLPTLPTLPSPTPRLEPVAAAPVAAAAPTPPAMLPTPAPAVDDVFALASAIAAATDPAPAAPSSLGSLGSLGSLTALTSLKSLTPLAPLASMTPVETSTGFTPLASVATTVTVPVEPELAPAATPVLAPPPAPTATVAPAPFTPNPTAPPYHVPDFGSIPVPEDVAAAVRRAITAIEAATATPARPAAVTFGPMHVTGAGRPVPFSFDDATRGLAAFADDPTTGTAAVAAPDPMPSFAPFSAVAGMSNLSGLSNGGLTGLQPLGDGPDERFENPVAAPINTSRRGALRRLIDGIRRRA